MKKYKEQMANVDELFKKRCATLLRFKYEVGRLVHLKELEDVYSLEKHYCDAVGQDLRELLGFKRDGDWYRSAHKLWHNYNKGQIGVLIKYGIPVAYAEWLMRKDFKEKSIQDIISGKLARPFNVWTRLKKQKANQAGTVGQDHMDPNIFGPILIRDHNGLIPDAVEQIVSSIYSLAPELVERAFEAAKIRRKG